MRKTVGVVKNITQEDVYEAFARQGKGKEGLQFIKNRKPNTKLFDFNFEYDMHSQRIKPVYLENLDPRKTEEGKKLLEINNKIKTDREKANCKILRAIRNGKYTKSKKQG